MKGSTRLNTSSLSNIWRHAIARDAVCTVARGEVRCGLFPLKTMGSTLTPDKGITTLTPGTSNGGDLPPNFFSLPSGIGLTGRAERLRYCNLLGRLRDCNLRSSWTRSRCPRLAPAAERPTTERVRVGAFPLTHLSPRFPYEPVGLLLAALAAALRAPGPGGHDGQKQVAAAAQHSLFPGTTRIAHPVKRQPGRQRRFRRHRRQQPGRH